MSSYFQSNHCHRFHLQVIVTVEDENDNTPTFPFASFSYLVPEGSPPNSALTPSVTADDPDQGSNGDIQYSLEPQTSASQPFTVDSNTGVVSLAPAGTLDREITSSYTFLLQAADQGTLSRTGSIQLMYVTPSMSVLYAVCIITDTSLVMQVA